MKILMFGQTGQVATEVQRQSDVIALGRDVADLCDVDALRAAIHYHQPDVVINAAAYTAVDRAEKEEALALAVNGVAPGVMAQECAARIFRSFMSQPIMYLMAVGRHLGRR
jgi:dTDP-4-dehydrorhamnose reductase